MKLAAIFALALACPAVSVAADDVQAHLDAKAEACITAGAPEVVRVEANLSSAVDFLTNDLCARDIEVAQKYGINRRLLDSEIETQKAMVASTRETSLGNSPGAPPLQIRPVRPATSGTSSPAAPSSNAAVVARQIDWRRRNLDLQEEKLTKLKASSVDPETGELIGGPSDTNSSGMEFVQMLLSPRTAQAPATFRAFAARAVLAARQAMR